MSDRFFSIALVISLGIHSVIFLRVPFLDLVRKNNELIRVKVAYLKNPPPLPDQRPKRDLIERKKDNSRLIDTASISRNEFFDREKRALNPKIPQYLPKPAPLSEPMPVFRKKISVPPVEEGNRINRPSYNSYYELIREKIRHSAYQNYSSTETGEVYIAFVVLADGSLKEAKYIEDKSTPSFYLKDISLRSIRAAAPFPSFPPDLDYPQLSFNVLISFQLEG